MAARTYLRGSSTAFTNVKAGRSDNNKRQWAEEPHHAYKTVALKLPSIML